MTPFPSLVCGAVGHIFHGVPINRLTPWTIGNILIWLTNNA